MTHDTSASTALPPASAWDLPAPHILPVRVEDCHIDVMQHANNVVYLQWLEDVAWSHSVELGLGPQDYADCGHGLVVRQHTLRYLAPTYLGDEVLLGTWITGLDRLSLHRRFQFVRARDGATVFRAETHYVCVDIAQGRVRRLPEHFLATYNAAVTPGVEAPAASR